MPVGTLPFYDRADDDAKSWYRRIANRVGRGMPEGYTVDELLDRPLGELGEMLLKRIQDLNSLTAPESARQPTRDDWNLVALLHLKWIDEVTDHQRETNRGHSA